MAEINVEDAAHGYVEMLHRLGVDYVFSSPGSEFVPIWEHLAKYNDEGKKPLYLNIRHEGAALSMAKGYAMATGRAQVVLTHVSAGLLHGAMELKAAYLDQVPLLLVVGQNRTHDGEVYGGTPGAHYLSFTEVGGQERLAPYVKWGDSPETNGNSLAAIRRAYEVAHSGVKGPTMLVLSRELIYEKVTRMRLPAETARPGPVTADPAALMRLRGMLEEARNPMVYTRYLGRSRAAVASLVELAELLGAPVFETPGYANFPTDNPLHMGPTMGPYLKDADLVFIIDASSWPPWYPPGSIRGLSMARIAFMDPDPMQLKYPVHGYPSDLALQADSEVALLQLIGLLREKGPDDRAVDERAEWWAREHTRIRGEMRRRAVAAREASPIDARWLCLCIDEAVDAGTVVVNETTTHSGLIHAYVERNRVAPGSMYEACGPVAHTGLGQALGVALGVKLAEPDKRVVALVGDGAFNYNPVLAAFGAAQEHGAPFMTVIFNNGCYAAMKTHDRYYPEGYSVRHGRYYGVSCGPSPDYSGVVDAFGGYGERVDDPSGVRAAVKRAFKEVEGGRLALLDVALSPTESP